MLSVVLTVAYIVVGVAHKCLYRGWAGIGCLSGTRRQMIGEVRRRSMQSGDCRPAIGRPKVIGRPVLRLSLGYLPMFGRLSTDFWVL